MSLFDASPFTFPRLRCLIFFALSWIPIVASIRLIESNSLNACMKNSSFQAELFRVVFTPDNGTASYNIKGVSQISSNIVLDLQVLGYGYKIIETTIDPCSPNNPELKGVCPMPATDIEIRGIIPVSKDVDKQVPGVIYYIPDLDGRVQVLFRSADTGQPLACVEADLSNGKTVHQSALEWVLAMIIGLGLIISAITSGLGNASTAAHLAANSISLFGYFQAQAYIGMTAVTTPPIVRSWTQNFQWSMGIIRVHFLQRLATWYQRATGGTPSTYLSSLGTNSVKVQKRATNEKLKFFTVRGIERVGFIAHIEKTNIFFTGYIFFVFLVLLTTLGVFIFKLSCDALVRSGKMRSEKFQDFRSGWTVMLKGILFRIVLISFPQVVVLCFWELTRRDSSAEVVLAITTMLTVLIILIWGALKVQRLARRSIKLHKNPAYILYSNLESLNKWGFLYIPFKAQMYSFIIPVLLHIFAKGLFVALGQDNGLVQAIGLLVLELVLLVTLVVVRPYMDKKTNAFNVSIAAVNFVNVLILLFFTGVFHVHPLAIGILGVVFFILNCVFAAVILFSVIWALVLGITSKNPEMRYPPALDDRGSFVKSQNNLVSELDALGATARGEKSRRMNLDDGDDEAISSKATDVSRFNDRDSGSVISSRPYSPYSPRRGMTSGRASPLGSDRFLQQGHASNGSKTWKTGVGY